MQPQTDPEKALEIINTLWSLIDNPPTYEEFNKYFQIGNNKLMLQSLAQSYPIQIAKKDNFEFGISIISIISTITSLAWNKKLTPLINPETKQIISWRYI